MKLADFMAKRGLTEQEVADQIGATQSLVNRLKHCKNWPSARIARRILQWSKGKVTPTDLLPERDEK